MRVFLAQCLCPSRHAVLAGAKRLPDGDKGDSLREELKERVEEAVAGGVIHAWCALCMAPMDTWFYEVKPTAFRSMLTAGPLLRQMEAEQRVMNEAFGDMPRSD